MGVVVGVALAIPSCQVFMLDPSSEEGKEMIEYMKLFLDHMVPARLGLLLVPLENQDVGVALCRGFSYLSTHDSPRRALSWLYKVNQHSMTVCMWWATLMSVYPGSKCIGDGKSHSG